MQMSELIGLIVLMASYMMLLFALVVWEALPYCTGGIRLSANLKSLRPFLEVCEISYEEAKQLFQEVWNFVYVHVLKSRLIHSGISID